MLYLPYNKIYVAEMDTYDAQYKANDSSNFDSLTIWVWGVPFQGYS